MVLVRGGVEFGLDWTGWSMRSRRKSEIKVDGTRC